MNVLLSIKPKYVEQIRKGNKKYEFRKVICNKEKIDNIQKIYIYSTFPIKKIVARFSIRKIFEEHPIKLWEICKDHSGLKREEFFKYFKDKEKGFAIEIKNIEFFDNPIDPFLSISDFSPPQSFYYLEDKCFDY